MPKAAIELNSRDIAEKLCKMMCTDECNKDDDEKVCKEYDIVICLNNGIFYARIVNGKSQSEENPDFSEENPDFSEDHYTFKILTGEKIRKTKSKDNTYFTFSNGKSILALNDDSEYSVDLTSNESNYRIEPATKEEHQSMLQIQIGEDDSNLNWYSIRKSYRELPTLIKEIAFSICKDYKGPNVRNHVDCTMKKALYRSSSKKLNFKKDSFGWMITSSSRSGVIDDSVLKKVTENAYLIGYSTILSNRIIFFDTKQPSFLGRGTLFFVFTNEFEKKTDVGKLELIDRNELQHYIEIDTI